MNKAKRKRIRGVVLTIFGLEKLEEARLILEDKLNFGERYTYEQISELTNLDVNTIKRILSGREPVDKRSLDKFCRGFQVKLTEEFYAKPRLNQRQDWGESVEVDFFVGRTIELKTLSNWLCLERCRLVTLLGMGGIGKTTLSIELARQVSSEFNCIVWKSLRDAPPVDEVVTYLIEFLAGSKTTLELSARLSDRISQLIELLRSERCLIVLDNAESLMDVNHRAGQYRQGYEGYSELFRRIGATKHHSCLILTTREKPQEIAILEGDSLPVRSLQLEGLKEGQEIIKVKGLSATDAELTALRNRYDGNPLALKVVSATIKDLFSGNITEFLHQEKAIFGGIKDLLDQQFGRLSNLEQEIMYWLAISREPVSLRGLQSELMVRTSSIKLLEALESLSRRSLIEKSEVLFTQQSVVMEYLTDRLVENICEEIIELQPQLLLSHALIQATAKDYVRDNQIRLILQPIIDWLSLLLRNKQNIARHLEQILLALQKKFAQDKSYGAGNIINLLTYLEIDLTGYDFSNLCVWQADLRQVQLHRVNFHNADLAKSLFAENFGGIWSVAFSPDGQYIAAGDTKGNILLRRVVDGTAVRSFSGHNAWVVSLAFSPDGSILASGSCDCTAKLWNTSTGQCLHSLTEHEHEVWSVAFHPDGDLLATGCDDRQIRLWNVETGNCLETFTEHTSQVLAVTFSLDGQILISGSQDKTIKLWNVDTRKCVKTFWGHEDGIRSLGVSPDGQILVSGSNDKTLRLWNINTGECLKVFTGHANAVLSVVFSPQGNLLASSSIGHKIRLWNINTGECVKVFTGHSNMINSIAFHPQGHSLASGSYDQSVRLWDIVTHQCLKTWQGYSNQTLVVTFSPDPKLLVSGGHDTKIRLWDIETEQTVQTLQGHENWVFSLAFVSAANRVGTKNNARILASASADKSIKLWNLDSGQEIATMYGHEAVVRSICLSPDGKILASGSEDATVKLWDLDTGQTLKTLTEHEGEIWSVAFNSNGKVLASASFDETVKLWDSITGKCLKTLREHQSWVFAVAFSADGNLLASTSSDRTIKLWDIETGKCVRNIQEDTGYSQLVVFSPDDRLIATCNGIHQIKLWQVDSGKCLGIFSGHTALIGSIAFDQDNQTIASSSEDETIKIWDIKTGACLKTLTRTNPYTDMNIRGVTGLSQPTTETLKYLGAVD
ncbi:MAG: NB-ARC domain-containing protein [Cyanobacteria bacterium J06600_6]